MAGVGPLQDSVVAGLEGGSAPSTATRQPAAPGGTPMLRMLLAHRNRNDEGATAREHALMVAAIAAVIVLVVFLLGGVVKDKFDKTCGAINSTDGTGTSCPAPAAP